MSTVAETAGEASAPPVEVVNIPNDKPVVHEKIQFKGKPTFTKKIMSSKRYIKSLISLDDALAKNEVTGYLQACCSAVRVVRAAAKHDKKR